MGLFSKKKEKEPEVIENRVEYVLQYPHEANRVYNDYESDWTVAEIESFFNISAGNTGAFIENYLRWIGGAVCFQAVNYSDILKKINDNEGWRKAFVGAKAYEIYFKFAILDYPEIFRDMFERIDSARYSKLQGNVTEDIKAVAWDIVWKGQEDYSLERSCAAIKFFLGFESIVADNRIFELGGAYGTVDVFKLMSCEQKLKYVQEKKLNGDLQAYLRGNPSGEPDGRKFLKAYAQTRQLDPVIEYAELMMGSSHNEVVITDADYVRKYKFCKPSLKALKSPRNSALNGYYLSRKDLSYEDLNKYMNA